MAESSPAPPLTHSLIPHEFAMHWNTETLLIVFVAFTGFAVFLQACVLLGILISLTRAAKSALTVTEDFRATVVPLIQSTRELIERATPQFLAATTNLLELTEGIRNETAELRGNLADILDRVHRQTVRLDSMLASGLDSIQHAAQAVETVVLRPTRIVNRVVRVANAMMDAYRYPRRSSSPDSRS